ncbi:hypothetical protein GOODEAATRI_012925, partial [Goodea atripinnis]
SSVIQQAAAVRTHSDLQVGEYSDWKEASAWSDQRWSQEISTNQVLIFFRRISSSRMFSQRGVINIVSMLELFEICPLISYLLPQVLVMTCHIFLHVLRSQTLPLSKINLVVFDDCHLAITEHPYCDIMKVRPLPICLAVHAGYLS